MSTFSARVPVAQLQATNAALAALGHGSNCFTVPAYAGPTASYGLLHAWGDTVFEANVTAQPDVVVVTGVSIPPTLMNPNGAINTDPIATTSAVAAEVTTQWGGDAKPLTGIVTPGLYTKNNVLWHVIQGYNTATYPDPTVIPALIRVAKIPGQALPWIQPLDQYDAYKLVNPFTGTGDLCTYNGQKWKVTQADGAGNNVWQPGAFGWTVVT